MPPPTTSSFFGASASQRSGGIHDPRVVPREARQLQRLRTGGDDALAEAQQLHPAVVARDPISLAETNLPVPCSTRTLRCLAIPARPLVSWPTTLSLQPRSVSRLIFGLPELDAELTGVRGLLDHVGGMQQRLGGNAADVEADAAQGRVALDEHGVQAEVGARNAAV